MRQLIKDIITTTDEEAYNCENETFDRRKIKISCPHCHRNNALLCSNKTKTIEGGLRWVGCDHQEPFMDYVATCPKCKKQYEFRVITPQ